MDACLCIYWLSECDGAKGSKLSTGTLFAGKYDLVSQLLAAKEASGKTFTQISKELGLTNAFTAQLFHNQACNSLYTHALPH